jgi:hypothetical protein
MNAVFEPNRGSPDTQRENIDLPTVNIDHLLSMIPVGRTLGCPLERSASTISFSDDMLTPDLDMSVFLQDPDDLALDEGSAHDEEAPRREESTLGSPTEAIACNEYVRHMLGAFSSMPTFLNDDKEFSSHSVLRTELCTSTLPGATGIVPDFASGTLLSDSAPPMALVAADRTKHEGPQASVISQPSCSAQTIAGDGCALPIQNPLPGLTPALDVKFYFPFSAAEQIACPGATSIAHPNSRWLSDSRTGSGQSGDQDCPVAENSIDSTERDVNTGECQGLTDEELLRLKPKKLRKRARFDKPIPSRFCHVCSRTPKNVRLAVCSNISDGVCRKVVCERCFVEYGYGGFDDAFKMSDWECPHCTGACPARAQCRTYSRINDRLRVTRLKQPKKQIRRKQPPNDEDVKAVPVSTHVARSSETSKDLKMLESKFQHILPTPSSNGPTVADFLTYIFNEPVVPAPDDPLKADIAGDLLRGIEHLI